MARPFGEHHVDVDHVRPPRDAGRVDQQTHRPDCRHGDEDVPLGLVRLVRPGKLQRQVAVGGDEQHDASGRVARREVDDEPGDAHPVRQQPLVQVHVLHEQRHRHGADDEVAQSQTAQKVVLRLADVAVDGEREQHDDVREHRHEADDGGEDRQTHHQPAREVPRGKGARYVHVVGVWLEQKWLP